MTFLTAIVMLVFAFTMSAAGQEPVDSQVKAALYEIERAEQQISTTTPKQAAKLKRIANLLTNADSQLNASSNKNHASWKAAKQRLDALNTQMQALQNPPTAAGGQLSQADINILGGINQQTDSFIQELNVYKPADYVRLKDNMLRRVENLKRQYRTLSNPQHPQAIAVAQKVLGVEQHVHNMVATYTAQPEVAEQKTQQNQISEQTAQQKPANEAATSQKSVSKQQTDQPSVEEVYASLEKIRQRMNPSNRSWFGSLVPSPPFDAEKISNFENLMSSWEADATKDLAYLEDLKTKTDISNVTSMWHRVTDELNDIQRYRQSMTDRIEQELAAVDQLVNYAPKVPDARIEAELARLSYGLYLLQYASPSGAVSPAERKSNYTATVDVLNKKSKAAKVAAAKPTTTFKKTSKKTKFTPQRIEMYGSRLIEITADGEVWVDGGKAGDITADGEIWVAGVKEGDLTKDGEVWKAGNKVGDVTKNGEVWREGNQVGTVESDGTIWVNSSRSGWFKGGDPKYAAIVVFYGFFGI